MPKYEITRMTAPADVGRLQAATVMASNALEAALGVAQQAGDSNRLRLVATEPPMYRGRTATGVPVVYEVLER